METKERRLGDILGEKFKPFEDSLKTYLKEQRFIENWEDYISGLSFKLCAWNGRQLGQSVSGSDERVPFMLGSSKVDYLENVEDSENIESNICEQVSNLFSDLYFDKNCIEKEIYYDAQLKEDTHVGQYNVMWMVSCKKEPHAVQKLIIKVILKFLNQCTDNLNIIEKADGTFWAKKNEEYKFNIMERYIELVFEEGLLPDSRIITKIAWQNYENKENKSKLIFIGEEEKEICVNWNHAGILLLHEGNSIQIGRGDAVNIANTRKMLETCSQSDGQGCYLLCSNAEKVYPLFGIITDAAFHALEKFNGNFWLVEFIGMGGWKLWKGNDVVLIYQRGEFFIDSSQKELALDEKIDSIKYIKEEKREVFKNILFRLQEQKHGALLIVSDDAKIEAEILCNKFGRGTLINEVDFSEESNLALLDGIAAVDGAVLVDFSGICYGFGVILDGDAKVKGDVSRGARYNSARNYVAGKNRCAVVVSEDKENGLSIVQVEETEVLSRDAEEK